MEILETLQSRFGVFNTGEKGTTFTQEKYPEKYPVLYEEFLNKYKKMEIPFGTDLVTPDGNTVGMVIDLDAHHGENQSEKILEMKKYLENFQFSFENSGKGFKFWILFDVPIPFIRIKDFCAYIRKHMEVEVYPDGKRWIRFPGLYKTRDKWSKDEDTGEQLDTLEKVERFWKKGCNSPDKFLDFLDRMGFKEKKIEKKINHIKRLIKSHSPSGMDNYFDLIWEHVTGIPVPEKVFPCPFHKDTNPSAYVYQNVGSKKVFICNSENCEMRNEKENLGRDALDILHFYMFKSTKTCADSIASCRAYLFNVILLNLFSDYLMVRGRGVEVNLMKISESLFQDMKEEDYDIRRDENGVYYVYCETKTWKPILSSTQHKPIGFNICKKLVEKKFRKEGMYYLEKSGMDTIAELVERQIELPENQFVQDFYTKLQIPVQNGVIDLPKYLAGEKDCLTPIEKEKLVVSPLNCIYDPSAVNKQFEEAMDFYLPDEKNRELFSQFVATALVPSIKISKILFCVGSGSNGKGTLLSVISEMFGEGKTSFVKLHDMDDRFRTFDIYGKWINIDSDSVMQGLTPKIVGIIKTITGDGPIVIERKYANPIAVIPLNKFIVACNKMPSMGDTNVALSRRILIVPFLRSIPRVNNRGGYWETLVNAPGGKSGILNYFLERIKMFEKENRLFPVPEKIEGVEEEKEFFMENDYVYGYLVSLFELDLNDPTKFPPKQGENRLTDRALAEGVTSTELYFDFRIYMDQTTMKKNSAIPLNPFAKQINAKINDNLLPSKYAPFVSIKKEHKKNLYCIDVRSFK